MLLLDTCALLWLVADQNKLSEAAKKAIENSDSGLFVSAISAFEIAIKHRNKKLDLPLPPEKWFPAVLDFHGIHELPVSSNIAILSAHLPIHHNDPCDRIIIASSKLHNMHIVTSDSLIKQYSQIKVIW